MMGQGEHPTPINSQQQINNPRPHTTLFQKDQILKKQVIPSIGHFKQSQPLRAAKNKHLGAGDEG